MVPSEGDVDALRQRLLGAYSRVRARTERLASPLSAEDQGLQSMPCCSPTKWHRAHTTWFFEAFLLAPAGVSPYDARWGALFNSYYEALGPRHARGRRGLLSRPSADEVGRYRACVDERVRATLERADGAGLSTMAPVVELGVAHEEQHQELLLTDVLNALHESPLLPAYRSPRARDEGERRDPERLGWIAFGGGLAWIGAAGDGSFRFDHEEPRHRAHLAPFELADRLVTVGEWKAFADARGYDTPSLWLSDGLEWVRAHGIRAPLYGRREGGALLVYDLDGLREAADAEPIAHLSYYEADALARFLGARLPTEAEWEVAASESPRTGNLLDDDPPRVRPASPFAEGAAPAPRQLFGDAWEWTSSAYAPYPGFRPRAGAAAEYNGKFMVDQLVLRGGSGLTPREHVRASYRNYWPAATRFQRTGLRLAR